ncbi:hypothetical protein PsorP6_007920 [Peronosclerospora sorghi]|uniref:Uncharacterized protein n=1 Tax=Peronosclerospora sorghi TaxID=230839 RepID=A0ACC0W850_9STRA|nr:hypothetical protein PsorP6_007920 [Peronosclerospora sorghi]
METIMLKLSYAGETHSQTVAFHSDNLKDDQVLSYELVLAKVHEAFPTLSGNWTLVYRDDEGDVITLSHALEFNEACHVLLDMHADDPKRRILHFYVLSRISFREKVMTPLLQKVVELAGVAKETTQHLRNSELLGKGRHSILRLAEGAVTQAGVAISHIRNSEVLGWGRESLGHSAAHTRTMLLSARSGVSTRLRRASSIVAAGIERRRSSSGSSSDAGFDPSMIKTPPPITSSPSSKVAVTVDLRQSIAMSRSARESDVDASRTGTENIVAGTEDQESETAYASDADTVCDDDGERECNFSHDSGSDETRETNDEWAQELVVLEEILGHVDRDVCCALLSHYEGNVQAVIVELTNV